MQVVLLESVLELLGHAAVVFGFLHDFADESLLAVQVIVVERFVQVLEHGDPLDDVESVVVVSVIGRPWENINLVQCTLYSLFQTFKNPTPRRILQCKKIQYGCCCGFIFTLGTSNPAFCAAFHYWLQCNQKEYKKLGRTMRLPKTTWWNCKQDPHFRWR